MEEITLEINSKIPGKKGSLSVKISRGVTVEQALRQAGFTSFNEMLVVFNGRTVYLSDKISDQGTLQVLPVLCGG